MKQYPTHIPLAAMIESMTKRLASTPLKADKTDLNQALEVNSNDITSDEARLIQYQIINAQGIRQSNTLEHFSNNQPINHQLKNTDLLKDTYVDIFVMPNTLWKMVFVSPKKPIRDALNALLFQTITYIGFIIAVGYLLFWLFLKRNIFSPLKKIASQLKESLNTPSMMLTDYPENELGEIAQQFNFRTQQMIVAQKMSEQASTAKSEFLANMSHEIRTPLNSIVGMTDLLKDDVVLSRDHHEMLDAIGYASHNLVSIVNDILDFSKAESGQIVLESIPLSPQQKAQRIINMLKPHASAKGLLLTLNSSIPADLYVLGDPVRLARVFTNIIGNAIKYTNEGKVEVYLSSQDYGEGNVQITLTVVDTGIGMAPEVHKKVFDKFVQADTSTTRKFGGTGLGLAITKQLVDLMKGIIKVESTVGKGSTFTVRLPFTITDIVPDSHTHDADVITPENAPNVSDIYVLVAEDHLLNQAFIKRFLPAMGIHHFTVVENGKEAVEALHKNSFDLVLMDCHMPEMNGYDATRAIRASDRITKQPVIIAMTANAMPEEREKCISTGMDGYISKPIQKHKFVKEISRFFAFSDKQPSLLNQPNNTALPVLDLNVLRSFAPAGSEEEREFVNLFWNGVKKSMDGLHAHIIDGHSKEWREYAHSLKGASAQLGAMVLRELCAKAQEMIDTTALARQSMYERISLALDELRNALVAEGLPTDKTKEG